ncbi:THADA/TRM732 family protein [Aspergillus candidus]|uniref:Putative death-receptor fusion protein-domain-containing protein n=1 Tax=Aspergillus candidus TaxID=41067 RepID=A0A2I2FI31_ASPCN|nr:putative death-receptor fusion protein-domain-containing protein [Aspergillus candidus]PLB40291.1 putative death-receptor fusion protein-domain-containing protein [Aspergillus candidus]
MHLNSASSARPEAGCDLMEQIAQQDIQILAESTLREISLGPMVKFTSACEEFGKVNRVWQCLLETFSTSSLSHTHNTAACNALSSFLDTAAISKCPETKQLALSLETWVAVYEILLTRYKDAKPKPMKQVLDSLMGLLIKNPDDNVKSSIRSYAVHATLPSIITGEPRSRTKACFLSLEVMLRKNALSPMELVSAAEIWLLKNHERWTPLYQVNCSALSMDIPKFLAGSEDDPKTVATEILALGFLTQAKTSDLATGSGATMAVFFQKLRASTPDSNLASAWVKPVRHVVLHNMDILEMMSTYILDPLFNVDAIGFRNFLETLPIKNLLTGDMSDAPKDDLTLLFASLQMAKKNGLVHEDHFFAKAGAAEKTGSSPLVLKSQILGQFLFHNDMSIRIAALSLLITAPSTTKPMSFATTRAILRGLPSMHAESDSYSRGEILSLVRRFIVRLKGGILKEEGGLVDAKIPTNKKQSIIYARDDAETESCLKQYIGFLKSDLRPTASYPRHITALKTLIFVLESGLDSRFDRVTASKKEGWQVGWRCNMQIFDASLLRLLVDLLTDPFEEVRATSLTALKWFPVDVLLAQGQLPEETPPFIEALMKAEQLASNTSRADHADTVARLYDVLFNAAATGEVKTDARWWETKTSVVDRLLGKLEGKLSVAGGLFNSSMRDAPLHGYVSALRYIVSVPNFHSLVSTADSPNYDNWRLIHQRIISISDKIWEEVKPVLCVDSPEGHTDEPVEDLDVGPKDILSYSWRALRESSLLLHATLANRTYGPSGELGLNFDDYDKIGTCSFTQLAELRHRGAFSTVSQTFATCCLRCSQTNDPTIGSLTHRWYQDAKRIIFETASKLTRRSAGLPALATGILTSQPGGPLFKQVMEDLHEISHLPVEHNPDEQNIPLPQVHAMNCLKDIFTNTKLGPYTEPFIMPGLTLSAERLGSPIWALRNSGLMLFRALLIRMCRHGSGLGFGGSSGSEPGYKVSFQKYPGLVELLASLLETTSANDQDASGDDTMVTERVFPAMELIAEKIPNVIGVDDDMLRRLVQKQLHSRVWGIREHAARVYASLLDRLDILSGVRAFVKDGSDTEEQNYLHGRALCVKYSLRRIAPTSLALWRENMNEIASTVRHIFGAWFQDAESPFVATTLLEILSDFVEKAVESESEEKTGFTLNYLFDTYHFGDILDFILDSSHPSWRALSGTRACSLLRRELSWVNILRLFVTNDFAELGPFFEKVCRFDSNAAQWLLERMNDIFSGKQKYRTALLSHFSSVIVGDYAEEVRGVAISCLATNLESLLSCEPSSIKEMDMPWELLDKKINSNPSNYIRNRDRSDADLRLQGCLIAAMAILHPSKDLQLATGQWATKLRFAMLEETEFTTRFAAVSSLASFGRVLRPARMSPRTEDVFLDVYLILYDMLNDDDEELRDLAASTASWVLSCSSVSPAKSISLSPLNASRLLSEFIATNYRDSQLLNTRVLRYVLGQEPRLGSAVSGTKLVPVADVAAELQKESTVLFEEEKQNLFIDEVREIDVWTGVLSSLTKDACAEGSIRDLCGWVSEGLECLAKAATEASGHDGLIGWASKPEMYALGVRVISLAGVFVSSEFAAAVYISGEKDALKEKLQALLAGGRQADVHKDWLLRIEEALQCS